MGSPITFQFTSWLRALTAFMFNNSVLDVTVTPCMKSYTVKNMCFICKTLEDGVIITGLYSKATPNEIIVSCLPPAPLSAAAQLSPLRHYFIIIRHLCRFFMVMISILKLKDIVHYKGVERTRSARERTRGTVTSGRKFYEKIMILIEINNGIGPPARI